MADMWSDSEDNEESQYYVGDALDIEDDGFEYVIQHIFDAEDYERTIYGHGCLIKIFDPTAAKGTQPLWTYINVGMVGKHTVPPGFMVEVEDSWVKFTKS